MSQGDAVTRDAVSQGDAMTHDTVSQGDAMTHNTVSQGDAMTHDTVSQGDAMTHEAVSQGERLLIFQRFVVPSSRSILGPLNHKDESTTILRHVRSHSPSDSASHPSSPLSAATAM